jgi:hypothetical protein
MRDDFVERATEVPDEKGRRIGLATLWTDPRFHGQRTRKISLRRAAHSDTSAGRSTPCAVMAKAMSPATGSKAAPGWRPGRLQLERVPEVPGAAQPLFLVTHPVPYPENRDPDDQIIGPVSGYLLHRPPTPEDAPELS